MSDRSGDNLLYTLKAGPAGGRLRWPSSAGNQPDYPVDGRTTS